MEIGYKGRLVVLGLLVAVFTGSFFAVSTGSRMSLFGPAEVVFALIMAGAITGVVVLVSFILLLVTLLVCDWLDEGKAVDEARTIHTERLERQAGQLSETQAGGELYLVPISKEKAKK